MAKKKFNSIKFGRTFLSFFLFLIITAFCLTGTLYMYTLNPNGVSKVFTTTAYTTSLYNDVVGYAEDMLLIENIDENYASELINFEDIKNLNESYIYGILETSQTYGNKAFESNLSEYSKTIENNFTNQLKKDNIKITKDIKIGINNFSNDLCEYIKQEISIKKLGTLKKILNYATVILRVFGIILFALLIIFILVIMSIGDKRHRSSRYISYSFFASSILDLLLIFGVKIVDHFKDLVLYPTYFRDAILVYINKSLECIFICAIFSFLWGAIFGSLTWNLRSKGK